MADDDFSLDDLDAAIFGRKTPQAKTTSASSSKPTMANLDSIFGDSTINRPKTGSSRVTFADPSATSGAHSSSNPAGFLDELFGSSAPPRKSDETTGGSRQATTAAVSASSSGRGGRSYGGGGTSSVFGEPMQPRKSEPVAAATPPAPAHLAAPAPSAPATYAMSAPVGDEAAARAARLALFKKRSLELEIERLNREIVDVKRQKKEDEEELERGWKEKLMKKENELKEETEQIRASYIKQIEKMREESDQELDRMQQTYARQLDAMTSSVSQTREVTGVVEKVEELTATINRLAGEVTSANDRTAFEKESSMRLSEQQLTMKLDNLESEKQRLEEDRRVIYELNTKLRDLIKEQERANETEKWKVKEEWNRLSAEKEIFKEDQKFVLENIQKHRESLEASKASFFREQHDLLVRVSNERSSLEAERADFHSQRSSDVRRLRTEAAELHSRAVAVQVAETHVEESKRHYTNKLKQLQELEAALMEECVNMERMRNQFHDNTEFHPRTPKHAVKTHPSTKPSSSVPAVNNMSSEEKPSDLESERNDESVRAVLKKHSEFLEKYIGQKVAAVAPQHPQQF